MDLGNQARSTIMRQRMEGRGHTLAAGHRLTCAAVSYLRVSEESVMERKKASDFPQELLNMFDQYVHGDINRRQFLEGANRFAIGGLTATALFESLRPHFAWAQQVAKDDSRIKTESVTVPSPQGNGNIRGYLVLPANISGKLPGVLVVHENRGLNPYIEDVARRLATQNFIVL